MISSKIGKTGSLFRYSHCMHEELAPYLWSEQEEFQGSMQPN
jgi:hypothetical protein